MKLTVNCPKEIYESLRRHLFQSNLEQAAFLFSETISTDTETIFNVIECNIVPSGGWDYQGELYLEMKDEIKAKFLKTARDLQLAIIDCHSHPFSIDDVYFSPTDRKGISEFSKYVKWKNDNRPFGALVFGKKSFDGVGWCGDYSRPITIKNFNIVGSSIELKATCTWNSPFKKWKVFG